MSGISSISSTSALWSTTSKTTSTSSVQDTFSQMVENLQSGAPATGYGDNGSSSSDDDTVTMTKVLSDGSVLITVMQDGKIISQTKTRAAKRFTARRTPLRKSFPSPSARTADALRIADCYKCIPARKVRAPRCSAMR